MRQTQNCTPDHIRSIIVQRVATNIVIKAL